jgi:hypothetical protein
MGGTLCERAEAIVNLPTTLNLDESPSPEN